jgi:PAS domain S-box-containing protein
MIRYPELSILFIDDSEMILEVMGEVMGLLFGTLYQADNALDGLRLFESNHPDIVLSDISMPGMDGLELAEKIRKVDDEVPIVFLTALSDPESMARAINVGADGYLIKPFNMDQVNALMARVVARVRTKRDLKYGQKLLHQYKQAIDASALVSQTDIKGHITYANDQFCEMSGYSKEELLGVRHNIIRHPDVPDALFTEMWETILAKKIWKGTVKNRRKNGEAYYVDATIVPMLDANDEIESFLGIRHDVTELEMQRQSLRKLIDEEVEQHTREREAMEQERLQSAKFLAIGRLAAGITHEINTPLTFIRGNMEMIIQDIQAMESGKQREMMLEDATSVMQGVNRIAGIVESMREVASQTMEGFETANIYATLQTALVMAHNRAKQITPIIIQGDTFELGMDRDSYRYMAEVQKQRLEQVWIIIISNALDVLKLTEPYEKRRLQITIDENSTSVWVMFQDTGGGIESSMMPKLFDAFESSKTGGGMGIGLNLARKIIKDHNGDIQAFNCGEGACFKVRLNKQISAGDG